MKPASDPLAALHDIHMPEPVSWWPPAPGWWLLLLFVLLGIAVGVWWHRRRAVVRATPRSVSPQAVLKAACDKVNALEKALSEGVAPEALVGELSILLRRVALGLEPDDPQLAGLSGEAWLAWLDRRWDRDGFCRGVGQQLLHAPYMRESQIDAAAMVQLVRAWLEAQR